MNAGLIGLGDFLGTYTYRSMLIGTVLIGLFSGGLGCLLYQRKQSLLADVIGHSAIAGVVGAFALAATVFGVNGRSMVWLTCGAIVSSALAAATANLISGYSRVRIDAAMAVCLALFYGGGMVGLRAIARSDLPNRQGINSYLFGNAATLTTADTWVILAFGTLAAAITWALWRPLTLYIFDPVFAAMSGYTGRMVGSVLFVITTVGIVIGIKTVGLVLMIGFAIMPAAAARQWTRHMHTMVLVAAGFGAFSGAFGSYVAVSLGKVPTGPVIVLVLFAVFALSLLLSPHRSLAQIAWARRRALNATTTGVPEAPSCR